MKITAKDRKDAILICAIKASSTHLSIVYSTHDVAKELDSSRVASELAYAAWCHVFNHFRNTEGTLEALLYSTDEVNAEGTLEALLYSTDEVNAEAEALLRTGWKPCKEAKPHGCSCGMWFRFAVGSEDVKGV